MKIYLAGYGSISTSYNVILPKINNIFYSYFYEKTVNKSFKADPLVGQRLSVVDSGAHTFFAAASSALGTPQKNKVDVKSEDPADYVKRYIKWIQANYDKASYFVELDIQDLVGYPTVEKWRRWYKDAGIEDKIIWCFHECNEWKDYEAMVDTVPSRYMAVEGMRSGRPCLPYNRLIKYAYDRKCKVHGFALVKRKIVNRFPFYSVDSSTWNVGLKYGNIPIFDNGNIIQLRESDRTKQKYFKYKIDLALLSTKRGKENHAAKLYFAATQFLAMEKWYTKYWEARGIRWED